MYVVPPPFSQVGKSTNAITEEEKNYLERVQKVSCKIILKGKYTTYTNALQDLKLENLDSRRQKMALNFGKKCVEHPQFSSLFPLNAEVDFNLRNREKYQVKFANCSRLKNSSVPEIQRLMNKEALLK